MAIQGLTPELVAHVLRHLLQPALDPWPDTQRRAAALASVRSARLACKALDAAAREHLVGEVELTPTIVAATAGEGSNIGGGGSGGLRSSRFPRLAALRLRGFAEVQANSLLQFMGPQSFAATGAEAVGSPSADGEAAGAADGEADGTPTQGPLAGITRLTLLASSLGRATLTNIVSRLPGLRAVVVERCDGLGQRGLPAACRDAGATRLTHYHHNDLPCDAEAAAWLATLPGLQSVDAGQSSACACAALPLEGLTSLRLWLGGEPLPASASARLAALAELRGVALDVPAARALAAGAPGLRVLDAYVAPAGDAGGAWPAAADAGAAGPLALSFPRLARASFWSCDGAFMESDLRGMLPALQHLCLIPSPKHPVPSAALARLAGLRSLGLHGRMEPPPDALAAVAALPACTALACTVKRGASLSRLSALGGIERLDLRLLSPRLAGEAIEAALCMPCLTFLSLASTEDTLTMRGGVLPHWRLVGRPPPRRDAGAAAPVTLLRHIALSGQIVVPAEAVLWLAALPGLLSVSVEAVEGEATALEAALAARAAGGGGPSVVLGPCGRLDADRTTLFSWAFRPQVPSA